jgi:hypothetical protein
LAQVWGISGEAGHEAGLSAHTGEPGTERRRTAVRRMADGREARQGTGSVDADGHDCGRLEDRHEPDEEGPAGRELRDRYRAFRARSLGAVRLLALFMEGEG